MGLPRRPRQHELSDESEVAFRALLPPRLIYRETQRDYGIDGEIEIVDERGQATGRKFLVQLKATDEVDLRDALRTRIRNTTAEYLRAQQAPVLMVRYLATSDALYGRWFHEFDPYYEHVGEQHLTFHWSENHRLTEDNIERLLADASRLIEIRSAELSLPVAVVLELPEGDVHDHSRAELRLAFESAVGRCPTDLRLVDDRDEADLKAVVRDDVVQASLRGLWSVSFHLGEGIYPPGTPVQLMVCDVMSCVAMTLGRAGLRDAGARVAVLFFPESMLTALPEMGAELAKTMIGARRVGEILAIAERLDQDDEVSGRQGLGLFFVGVVRDHETTLQPQEQAQLEAALRGRLHRRLEAGRTNDAAAAAENLGKHLMAVRRPTIAIEFLEQAVALDPNREDEDLAQRLAGAYFLSHRYAEAIPAYDRAIELGDEPDPHMEARRADALMYAGHYRAALSAFEDITTEDVALMAWIYVKTRALNWAIQTTGIEEQEPDSKRATELAGEFDDELSDAATDDLARQIWNCDALSPLGWFNWAWTRYRRDLPEDAMSSYVIAAVMREGDVEAWVNVTMLAGSLGDHDLFLASAVTGDRLNRHTYLEEFARQARETVSDLTEREEMITAVRSAIAAASENAPDRDRAA